MKSLKGNRDVWIFIKITRTVLVLNVRFALLRTKIRITGGSSLTVNSVSFIYPPSFPRDQLNNHSTRVGAVVLTRKKNGPSETFVATHVASTFYHRV